MTLPDTYLTAAMAMESVIIRLPAIGKRSSIPWGSNGKQQMGTAIGPISGLRELTPRNDRVDQRPTGFVTGDRSYALRVSDVHSQNDSDLALGHILSGRQNLGTPVNLTRGIGSAACLALIGEFRLPAR